MSHYQANVTWQSPNGAWNVGIYERYENPFPDDDYDSEWDAEYNYDRFGWVTSGHPDSGAAFEAMVHDQGNPGSTTVCEYAGHEQEIARYDQMARECRERAAARRVQGRQAMAAMTGSVLGRISVPAVTAVRVAPKSECGMWMPISKTYCIRAPGHKGSHRARHGR